MKNRMSSFCIFGLMIVLPFRASAQETKLLATLKGHNECVLSLAISPDSKTLVSGGFDKTIKVWDIATGNEKETLRGHTNHVNSLAFSPDGTTLASGGDTTISLWKLSKAGERTILKGHTSLVYSVAYNPDGKSLASGGDDLTIRIWDLARAKEQAILKGESFVTTSLVYSADGKTLAAATSFGESAVRFWEVPGYKMTKTMQGHPGVFRFSYGVDGKTVASIGDDLKIWLWEGNGMRLLGKLEGHKKEPWSMAYLADGKRLATAGLDMTVRIWDIKTLQEIDVLKHNCQVFSVAGSPDGRILATGGFDGTVRLFRTRKQKE